MPNMQPTRGHEKQRPATLALCISDVHWSHSAPPAFASKDWYPHMERTIDRLHAVWVEHGEPLILVAGDLFHRWNEPVGLVSFISECINSRFGRSASDDKVFLTITGQHDLPYHNYDLVKRSAYHALHNMTPRMFSLDRGTMVLSDGGLVVSGWGWGSAPNREHRMEGWDGHDVVKIAMQHRFAYNGPDTGFVGVENHDDTAFNHGVENYDVTHYGDNHIRWASSDVVNPGTFMVRNRDDIGKITGPFAVLSDRSVLSVPFETHDDPVLELPKRDDAPSAPVPTATEVLDRLASGVSISDMATMLREYLRESPAPESVKNEIKRLYERTKK